MNLFVVCLEFCSMYYLFQWSNILNALSVLQEIGKLQQTLGKLRLHLLFHASCFEYLSNSCQYLYHLH